MVLGLDYGKLDLNFFIKVVDFEMWDILINVPFIPTFSLNDEVVIKAKLDKTKIKEKSNFVLKSNIF